MTLNNFFWKINIYFAFLKKKSSFLKIYKEKKSKKVPKTKLVLNTAKTIYIPYILSYFFIKMLLFDIDLFLFVLTWNHPEVNIILVYWTWNQPFIQNDCLFWTNFVILKIWVCWHCFKKSILWLKPLFLYLFWLVKKWCNHSKAFKLFVHKTQTGVDAFKLHLYCGKQYKSNPKGKTVWSAQFSSCSRNIKTNPPPFEAV